MSLRATYLASDGLALAELLRTGELAPAEAVECAAEIASELNGDLNAVVCSDFERAAAAAPEAVAAGGPFGGVPYLLKDLYANAVGLPLTNGSRLFEGSVPDHDSEMVSRYRQAGLLIAGRTASPEFGLTTSTEVRGLRADAQPLGPGAHRRWFLGRRRGGRRRRHRAGRPRQRRRRIDPYPGLVLRTLRTQAEPRPGFAGA